MDRPRDGQSRRRQPARRSALVEAHRLGHRIGKLKRSNDPEFAEKVEDIVGLYMDPPKHAVVVSIDEKSQDARRSTARSRACRLSPENAGR